MSGYVLGLDLSLTASAVASSAGWVEVTGTKGSRSDTYDQRLQRIGRVAFDVAILVSPDAALAVVEGPSYRSGDPSAFDRAALWWQAYRYLCNHGIPIAVITPSQRAVYATGKGTAGKGAVVDAVARRWPQYATGGDDNAADAVVLMAMGLDYTGAPLTWMPASHRRALDRVRWPELLTGDNDA